MTIALSRVGWIDMFSQMRRPNMYLTRFFTVKPGGVYDGEKVAIDIERVGEDVAIAIKKCTGPNLNDISIFTTKEFEPPAYGEAFNMNVCDLLNRMAGVDPHTAAYAGYAADMIKQMAKGFVIIDDKIRRAAELQASQIFQTGKLDLLDSDGATRYELDFKPKTTHFPTTSTSWSDAASDPLGDLESLCEVISADGKVDPDTAIMGAGALKNAMAATKFKDALDNRRITLGEIRPEMMDSGAVYAGTVWAGAYKLDLFTYKDVYTSPATGNPVKYIADDKVVVLSSRTRFDMTSARVPLPLGPDPRVANLLPGRMTSATEGFDVTPNVYPSPNGKQIFGELESRPLLIPVQIDGFGCLDTII